MSLDVDMASAACPDCNILVVEANSTNFSDLGAAEIYAASVATVVSNSYGGKEDNTISGTDAMYFNHPNVGIFVSAGDSGYGVEYPASSQYVTAVGGTKLVKATNARGWTESAWGSGFWTFLFGGGGSGCSAYITKPSWQKDTGCKFRTVADVSANAAPGSGPAIYDTYGGAAADAVGWITVGGTSASSPLVAGIYAITGQGAAGASLSYTNPSAFYDVTTGNNGSCSPKYLCTAGVGYDGPTGNGTPNGAVLSTIK
jgi:subtilase family serine protease